VRLPHGCRVTTKDTARGERWGSSSVGTETGGRGAGCRGRGWDLIWIKTRLTGCHGSRHTRNVAWKSRGGRSFRSRVGRWGGAEHHGVHLHWGIWRDGGSSFKYTGFG
jgi:hypothetical protein